MYKFQPCRKHVNPLGFPNEWVGHKDAPAMKTLRMLLPSNTKHILKCRFCRMPKLDPEQALSLWSYSFGGQFAWYLGPRL